ncbi:hypothetical protein JTY60_01195 [symbiont of Argiope bruennichi]|uniref:hypothetical protein n=1 Tax=symbiont of Argiope bruennichi TaxID=2810479 RepID=UPI003DA1CA2F
MKTFFDLELIEIGNKGEILFFDHFNSEDLSKKINKDNYFEYIKSNKKNYDQIDFFYDIKYFSNFLYDGTVWKSEIFFLKNNFYKIVKNSKIEGIKYNFDFLIKKIENYDFWYKNYNSKDILNEIKILFEKNIKFYTYTDFIDKLNQLFYLYIEVVANGWFQEFTKIKLLAKKSEEKMDLYNIENFKTFYCKDDFLKFNEKINHINQIFFDKLSKLVAHMIKKYNFYNYIYQFIGAEYNLKFKYKSQEYTFLELHEILIFSNKNIYFFYDQINEYLKNAFNYISEKIIEISKDVQNEIIFFQEKKFFNISGSIKDEFVELNHNFLRLIKNQPKDFYLINDFFKILWKLNNSYLKFFFIIAKKNYQNITEQLKKWNYIHKKKAILNIISQYREALTSFSEEKLKNFLDNHSY